jgi:hypothetical protein
LNCSNCGVNPLRIGVFIAHFVVVGGRENACFTVGRVLERDLGYISEHNRKVGQKSCSDRSHRLDAFASQPKHDEYRLELHLDTPGLHLQVLSLQYTTFEEKEAGWHKLKIKRWNMYYWPERLLMRKYVRKLRWTLMIALAPELGVGLAVKEYT